MTRFDESAECNDSWDKYRLNRLPGPRERQPTYHDIWIDAWNASRKAMTPEAKENRHDEPR